MVDDAHGIGVMGSERPRHGRTLRRRSRRRPHHGHVQQVLRLPRRLRRRRQARSSPIIKHHARSLIFSAAATPASVATVLATLDIIENEPERRKRLWQITTKMRTEFQAMGYNTGALPNSHHPDHDRRRREGLHALEAPPRGGDLHDPGHLSRGPPRAGPDPDELLGRPHRRGVGRRPECASGNAARCWASSDGTRRAQRSRRNGEDSSERSFREKNGSVGSSAASSLAGRRRRGRSRFHHHASRPSQGRDEGPGEERLRGGQDRGIRRRDPRRPGEFPAQEEPDPGQAPRAGAWRRQASSKA